MNESEIKGIFIKDPSVKLNVSTELRKKMMISNDLTIIHHGNLHDIKFKNLGGGVYEVFCERRNK